MNWASGYVTEMDYPYGYYRELAPSSMTLAATLAGVSTAIGERPLRYLELGCGQGLSVNIHAAACEGEFWGTDFNPAHARHAQHLAAASGGQARMFDASFEELLDHPDLPEFDVIALHGTWSWVSAEHRATIVELVRRHLGVGGVLYISYNSLPGWAIDMPMRHLAAMHARKSRSPAQGLSGRIDDAMEFAQKVAGAGHGYFAAAPASVKWLERVRTQNKNYLAHEYFNDSWHPMYFSEFDEALSEAKLSFATTATLLDPIQRETMPKASRDMLQGIADPAMRETVFDYLMNQRFRRDLFVKGPLRISTGGRAERLSRTAFVLLSAPSEIPMSLKIPGCEMSLQESIYKPLLEVLADRKMVPKTLAEISADRRCKPIQLNQLIQAIQVLCGAGYLNPAQLPASASKTARNCKSLNAYLMARAMYSDEVEILASPVTGTGVQVVRFHQMFLLSLQKGAKSPADWAAFAWEALKSQGQRLVKSGKTIESEADNLKELQAQAAQFESARLPVLRALGIA